MKYGFTLLDVVGPRGNQENARIEQSGSKQYIFSFSECSPCNILLLHEMDLRWPK